MTFLLAYNKKKYENLHIVTDSNKNLEWGGG